MSCLRSMGCSSISVSVRTDSSARKISCQKSRIPRGRLSLCRWRRTAQRRKARSSRRRFPLRENMRWLSLQRTISGSPRRSEAKRNAHHSELWRVTYVLPVWEPSCAPRQKRRRRKSFGAICLRFLPSERSSAVASRWRRPPSSCTVTATSR